ncbi:DUF2218 domain-containing protein [Salipiger sp. P9]|uniref:DUF2218 domain-containing protein n=1 Tax=Salipiger pentaromativorans TaxID=2943193 RepID=UPI002158560F|nr:DUF2218 domain-containing protein [Salipiger pentaromativorans]MCR8550974.1 DUF2218 domain-containing protein [Salipiger pentaromativorans]
MSLQETGTFQTPNASKYLQQLCKHFAHKIEVEYDATSARMALPTGPATLNASDETLHAEISAEDNEGLLRARGIIDKHLERFAFREEFSGMTWTAA